MKRVSQACVYFFIFSFVSIFAESAPENLFKNNQEIILKSGLSRFENYYFGTARVKSRTNSTSSRLGAISESKLLAKARFVDYLFSLYSCYKYFYFNRVRSCRSYLYFR